MKINAEIFDHIIRQLISGKSRTDILIELKLEHFDLFEYFRNNPESRVQWDSARIYNVDVDVEDLKEIADNDNDSQRARNRIDVRKWTASKINPQKYGERIELNISKTIDINAAISEGRSRMVSHHEIPLRDLEIVAESDSTKNSITYRDETTGPKPVSQAKSAPVSEDDDIYD